MTVEHAEGRTTARGAAASARVEPQDLAEALADLARQLQREVGTEETLQAAVSSAIEVIPGAAEGSISVVVARSRVESRAAIGELPRTLDDLQNELGEGPCLSAAFEAEVVDVPDLATETRWPAFAGGAVRAGAGSMLCLRLYVSGSDLGAMNLYSPQPHAFSEESHRIGLPFAAHAAVALAQSQERADLLAAVDGRDVIGQAKGILMERHKLTADQAFQLLASASQQRNVKLRVLAQELIFSGQLRGMRGSI